MCNFSFQWVILSAHYPRKNLYKSQIINVFFVGEDVHILKPSRFRVTGQEGEVAKQKESFPLMGRNDFGPFPPLPYLNSKAMDP